MIKKLIRIFIPPEQWKVPVIILLGIFVGLGAYVMKLSKAHLYLGDAPETCVNCHVMAPQYATWSHSSHREVANCSECHVPQHNMAVKYYFKAMDGLRHSYMFTFRLEPQVIFIKEAGKKAVQDNCIRCHADQVIEHRTKQLAAGFEHKRTDRSCIECHREVPHGRVNSLSSVPDAMVPVPQSPVPKWMRSLID